MSKNETDTHYKYADDYFRALRLYGANWQEGVRQECVQQVEEAQRKAQQKVQEAQRKFQEEQRLRQEEERKLEEERRLRQETQQELAALRARLKQYQREEAQKQAGTLYPAGKTGTWKNSCTGSPKAF